MNELLVQLQMKMEAFQKDAALQAEKGNKAAGQRARCVSLEICCISKPCLSVSFLPESVLLRYGSAGEAVPVPDSLAGKPSLR